MSAPAIKLRPAPISTIAFTVGSALPLSTAATMPSGTPGDSALTGGLSTMMTPIPLTFSKRTKVLSAILHSYRIHHGDTGGTEKNSTFNSYRRGGEDCSGA